MTEARMFALGDILSITSGQLVSRDHMDGSYRILNFMTGDDLMTHQIPRAMRECEDPLAAQHPQLVGVRLPDGYLDGLSDPEELKGAVYGWLDEQEALFGAELPVEPMGPEHHTSIDPIAELRMMRPDMPIIVADCDGGEL